MLREGPVDERERAGLMALRMNRKEWGGWSVREMNIEAGSPGPGEGGKLGEG